MARQRWLPAMIMAAAIVVSACNIAPEPSPHGNDTNDTSPGSDLPLPSGGTILDLRPAVSGACPDGLPDPAAGRSIGGRLRLAVAFKLTNLNAILHGENYEGDINGDIYSSLFWVDTDGSLHGDVAQGVHFSDDRLTVTIALRNDVYFHNGDQLTAADVAFTLNAMLDPDFDSPLRRELRWLKDPANEASGYFGVAAVTALDDTTVVITLSDPFTPILHRINVGILNHRLFAGVPIADLADAPASHEPVGSGPYKFVSYDPESGLLLARNDKWHRCAELGGAPFFAEMHFGIPGFIGNELAAFENGELDMIWSGAQAAERWREQYPGRFVPVETENSVYTVIVFNTETGPTRHPEVRQALVYALDRDANTVDRVAPRATAPTGPLPSYSWAYNPVVEQLAYDPAKANRILDEAGWLRGADGVRAKDGERLAIRFAWREPYGQTDEMPELMQQQWAAIGAVTELTRFGAGLRDEYESTIGAFDAATFTWYYPSLEPDGLFPFFHGSASHIDPYGSGHPRNYMRYSNPDVDRLLEQARREVDPDVRANLYAQFQDVFVTDVPMIPLFASTSVGFYNSETIKGGIVNLPNKGPTYRYLWYGP